MEFNSIERRIINVLYRYQTPLTTSEIVKYTGHSFNTVKGYLLKLNQRKYVRYKHAGNAIHWWLREE